MAKCPKCGRKLHLYDWRPECPDCHVNMIFYQANERMLADSENAEIEHAKSQPGIDRAKAAFFGSSYAVIRIVLSLVAIAPLFLPLWFFYDENGVKNSINVLGVYKFISEATFGGIFGKAFGGDMAAIAIVCLLVSAVMILVGVICLFMSLGRHGRLRNHIINGIKLFGAVAGAGLGLYSFYGGNTLWGDCCQKAGIGIGMILYIILIVALIVYNEILHRKRLIRVKPTRCLIGGIPSDEYFALKEQGASELEIRKRMVVELTKMQNEIREKEKQAEEETMKKNMEKK